MTPPIRHALIMAAGRGIRMLPMTDELPKAMAPYDGTTLIARGIDRVRRHVANVHVTVGHHKAMLASHVIEHDAATVINTEGHGNAWWLYNTFLSLLDEPLLVLTCDNVTDLDIGLLARDYAEDGDPACMIVPVEPVAGLEGDYIRHEDHVIVGLSRTEPAPTYASGIQVVNPTKIRTLTEPCEDFEQVWEQLMPLSQLRAARVYPKEWFSVDTVPQLEELRRRGR